MNTSLAMTSSASHVRYGNGPSKCKGHILCCIACAFGKDTHTCGQGKYYNLTHTRSKLIQLKVNRKHDVRRLNRRIEYINEQ